MSVTKIDTPTDTPLTTAGLRAFRFAFDPTPDQLTVLSQHTGAARWAFNHALARKIDAYRQWRNQVDELVSAGIPEPEARRRIKISIPTKQTIQKDLNVTKRIALARFNSTFSRLSRRASTDSSVDVPDRDPASTSTWRTHLRTSGVPILKQLRGPDPSPPTPTPAPA